MHHPHSPTLSSFFILIFYFRLPLSFYIVLISIAYAYLYYEQYTSVVQTQINFSLGSMQLHNCILQNYYVFSYLLRVFENLN